MMVVVVVFVVRDCNKTYEVSILDYIANSPI